MRLFVAVEIPPEIKEKLWSAAKEFGLKGVILAKKETYHITLQFLGETDETKLSGIKDALSSVRQEGFGICISGVSTFDPTLSVIFAEITAGSEELRSLYKQIDSEFAKRKIAYKNENKYKPHVTLARVRFTKDKTALLKPLQEYSSFEFGKFKARSILLKVSKPEGNGYTHETLQKVELQ